MTPEGPPRRLFPRILAVAVIVAAVLLGAIVLMDFFGSQPQPFQYLLH